MSTSRFERLEAKISGVDLVIDALTDLVWAYPTSEEYHLARLAASRVRLDLQIALHALEASK